MTGPTSVRLLKFTLWTLAGYFFLISLAHAAGAKLPLLFVYFDVPSTLYQDRIISFFAFGWAVFIATAARSPRENLKLVRALIISAIGALAMLSYINLTTDFTGYSAEISVWKFWAQTALLAAITAWLAILYRSAAR